MTKKKSERKKSRADKFFLLSWKKLGIIIGSWFLAVLLHNGVYAIFINYFEKNNGDEAFFFIVATIIIPIYFLVCLVYSLVKILRYR